ncbi:hypothetical protein [Aquimonas voraii]|uniref:PQQ-like domain-containing protein n=1 Tax=Aquimonas voraii TaxID=265719 RepID=A0A1G6XQ03_9GAMM|nr:hypothetical protein [Aquimonas voraii]SDD80092.1 hypothetical protein SAMN04488509_10790 [Aquimonas voraii]
MSFSVRALVPIAVLALTLAALVSAVQSGSADVQAAPAVSGELSARGLWADARGNTVLVSERLVADDSRQPPEVELRFFDAQGRTAWILGLGEGAVTALVDDRELLYLALARGGEMEGQETRTQLLAVAMDGGQIRWRLDIVGEVTDLLADGVGGVRARSLRLGPGVEAGEHLLSLRDGVLLWDVPLRD